MSAEIMSFQEPFAAMKLTSEQPSPRSLTNNKTETVKFKKKNRDEHMINAVI